MSGITHRWTEQLLGITDAVDEVLAGLVTDNAVDDLWTGPKAAQLGWLEFLAERGANAEAATAFVDRVVADGFENVVILADAQLSPFVRALLDRADRSRPGHTAEAADGADAIGGFRLDRRGTTTTEAGLKVHLADTAHPEVVARLIEQCPVDTTLVIPMVGDTHSVSVLALLSLFWERSGEDGSRFSAIAPAGSLVAELAVDRGFRQVFTTRATASDWAPGAGVDVDEVALDGGFAALSPAGLVPAALVGLNPTQLVEAATETSEMLQATGGPAANLGLRLGAVLVAALRSGRNLLSLVVDPDHGELARAIAALVTDTLGPAGLVPVVDEGDANCLVAGEHRLFVGINTGAGLNRVVGEGHPAVAIEAMGPGSIAAHLLTWQFAVAAAMVALDIWPAPSALLVAEASAADETQAPGSADSSGADGAGAEDAETDEGVATGDAGAAASNNGALAEDSIEATTLSQAEKLVQPGDHVALLVSADPDGDEADEWAQVRLAMRDRLGVITSLHFVPHTAVVEVVGDSPVGDHAGLIVFQVPTVDGTFAESPKVPGLETTFAELARANDNDQYRALKAQGVNTIRIAATRD